MNRIVDVIPIIIGFVGSFLLFESYTWGDRFPTFLEFGVSLIPLIVGSFITSILRQLEYKAGEPSYRCECGFDVYFSSKEEHDKVCGSI